MSGAHAQGLPGPCAFTDFAGSSYVLKLTLIELRETSLIQSGGEKKKITNLCFILIMAWVKRRVKYACSRCARPSNTIITTVTQVCHIYNSAAIVSLKRPESADRPGLRVDALSSSSVSHEADCKRACVAHTSHFLQPSPRRN